MKTLTNINTSGENQNMGTRARLGMTLSGIAIAVICLLTFMNDVHVNRRDPENTFRPVKISWFANAGASWATWSLR